MSNDDMLTDDYVAGLLAKDAKDCSLKYSAMGMEAFNSVKKPANMPKPNTRFLRSIIRNTDTHNKNLLAREAAESKARLEDLEHAEEVKRLKTNPNERDIRRRQMGDIHAILGGKRRRKTDDESSSSGKQRDPDQRRCGDGGKRRVSSKEGDLFRERGSRRHHGRLAREDHVRHGTAGGDARSDDDDDESSRRRRHRRRERDRSCSPRRRRRSDSPSSRHRHRHRSPRHRSDQSPKPSRHDDTDCSDPLEDFVGPMPAPRPRGRGALTGSSGIDRRFSETYNPKDDLDVAGQGLSGGAAASGAGGWEDSVEAFRDRQKLRQNQEQRLRAAGFGDDEIRRMQGGGGGGVGERSEEDVRWSKAGEEREWDKDKDLDV